jgi:DnaA-homolog protein
MQQFTLDVAVDRSPNLENFYPEGNDAVHQHLRLWLGASGGKRSPVPTYLWGESGTGKTHLLHALQQGLRAHGEAFGYLDFCISSAQVFNPNWQAVFLEDVHLFNAQQQHTAFNWFVNSQTSGCPVVATGDAPPAQLLLRDDLRSRLGWGDIYALQALSDDGQQQVLRQSAHARGLLLTDEVLDYMSTRFSRDLVNLMQWLDKLDQYALQTKRAITLPLLKEMLDNFDSLL